MFRIIIFSFIIAMNVLATEPGSRLLQVLDVKTDRPVSFPHYVNHKMSLIGTMDGYIEIKEDALGGWLKVPGYKQIYIDAALKPETRNIYIQPFTPKGVYLSLYGVDSESIRERIMELVELGKINTLVIDVKNGEGRIAFPMKDNTLAKNVGAQKILTIRRPEELLKSLKEAGIYTIARVAVFKDDLLAQAKPEWSVMRKGGGYFEDRQKMRWTDPFEEKVRAYNLNVAIEAAKLGFDEIQFDYVRFPDHNHLLFAQKTNEKTRTATISGFLEEANEKISPYGAYVSADIFGYTIWDSSDVGLGQKLEAVSPVVDYVSPMLYPSGFEYGIPSHPNPMESAYEVIYNSLEKARMRTGLDPVRFRPWLQAFRDYAFDRRNFKAKMVSEQIRASDDFASHGWLLWNPRNSYTAIFPAEEHMVSLMEEGKLTPDTE